LRALAHFGLIASLLVAFAQAPFDHTHDSDPYHEHAEGLIHAHAHWEAEAPNGSAVASPDHDGDVRFKEWFCFEGKTQIPFVGSLPMAPPAAKLTLAVSHSIADFAPRSHDPPFLRILQSRAPPA
jgi:hypothetical protein